MAESRISRLTLLLIASTIAVGCSTAPLRPPVSAASGSELTAPLSTKAMNFALLPDAFVKHLSTTAVPIIGLPSSYATRIGRPAVRVSTGTYVLMDKTTIANRKWQPPLVAQILDVVPSRYRAYINSNAFLFGIDPRTLDMPTPQSKVTHPIPSDMPIRQQSEIRLTCVAHASMAAMELMQQVPHDLSEQYAHHVFLQNLTEPANCCNDGGVFVLDAATDLKATGIPPEAAFPYTQERPACKGVSGSPCNNDDPHDATLEPSFPRYRVTGVGEIPGGVTGPAIGNPAYLEAILESGYNIVIEVGIAWLDDKAADIFPVLRLADQNNQPLPEAGYHAMLLTGYDRDRHFFIARNSMGSQFGNHGGEAWLSYDYVTTYGVAGFIITSVVEEPAP